MFQRLKANRLTRNSALSYGFIKVADPLLTGFHEFAVVIISCEPLVIPDLHSHYRQQKEKRQSLPCINEIVANTRSMLSQEIAGNRSFIVPYVNTG